MAKGRTKSPCPASPGARPEVRLEQHFHGCELKAQIDTVLGFAIEVIHDKPESRLHEEHSTAMDHRVRQVKVGVVLGIGEVERLGGEPAKQARARAVSPGERPCGCRLLHPITITVLCAAEFLK